MKKSILIGIPLLMVLLTTHLFPKKEVERSIITFSLDNTAKENVDIYVNGMAAASLGPKNRTQKVSVHKGTLSLEGSTQNSKRKKYSIDNSKGKGGSINVFVEKGLGLPVVTFETTGERIKVTAV